MSILHRFLTTAGVILAVMLILTISVEAQTITSSGLKGNWSSPTTWVGGVLPGPSNTVQIAAGDSVGLDTSFVVTGLIVGEATGAASRLRLIGTKPVHMTINGNLLVNAGSAISIAGSTWDNPGVAGAINEIIDTLLLSGNFTSNGVFDLSTGTAGTSKHNVRIVFVGSTNSTVTCGNYVATSTNEFAGLTFRKTGGAKVILNNNIFTYGGSNSSAPNVNPFVYFESGIVEAINGALIAVWTNDTTFIGYNNYSYVVGAVGRAVSNGGGVTTKEFPVGDANGFRPVRLRFIAPANVTGHYVKVRAVAGDAAGVTSTLGAGIDKVASVRYYEVSLGGAAGTSPTQNMTITNYHLKYRATDGVASGNENLRVAISDTSTPRSWKNAGPLLVPHMTRLDTSAYIASDSTVAQINMFGAPAYVALARATGTTDNSLVGTGTSVGSESEAPTTWVLGQNYPNPFNPSTKISYGVPANGYVSLAIFNLLGQRVATLFEGTKAAGTHTAVWDGRDASGRVVPSGVYIYRMEGGGVSQARRMVLMK